MSEHIGFNEEREVAGGKPLTDEQRKHLKKCVPCKFRLGGTVRRPAPAFSPAQSWWQRFVSGMKSILGKRKTS